MRIDWQAYEDGLMGAEETEMANKALRDDPAARKELDGFRSFRKMVRSAVLREPVPHKRLRAILRAIVGTAGISRVRRYALIATTAVAATAVAFVSFVALNQPGPNDDVREHFSSVGEAQAWASERSGLEIPNLELASLGGLESVHSAESYACFDYMLDGKRLHVFCSDRPIEKSRCIAQESDAGTLYIDRADKSVKFEGQGDLTLAFYGCEEDVRIKAAETACRQVRRP